MTFGAWLAVGSALSVVGVLWYALRTGAEKERAKSLEASLDQARDAARIAENVSRLPGDDVRDRLRKRVRRPL